MANCIHIDKTAEFVSFHHHVAIAGEHRKCHNMRAHEPQAVSDRLNPLSLGTMSASVYIENLA